MQLLETQLLLNSPSVEQALQKKMQQRTQQRPWQVQSGCVATFMIFLRRSAYSFLPISLFLPAPKPAARLVVGGSQSRLSTPGQF